MRQPAADVAVPVVGVPIAANAGAGCMPVVRVPTSELCDASRAPCSRRLHVVLFLLGLFLVERASQLRPEVQFSKSGPGGRSSCDIWGSACAWAATAAQVGEEEAHEPLPPRVVRAIDEALEKLRKQDWMKLLVGVLEWAAQEGSKSGSATAAEATGAPRCSPGSTDSGWPMTYVVLETVYTPLIAFARERLQANDEGGDHAAMLSMLREVPYRIVIDALQDVPILQATTTSQLGTADILLEKLTQKTEALMQHTVSRPDLETQVNDVAQELLRFSVVHLRRMTFFLTCSHRFHLNRVEFFILVKEMVPRVIKLLLIYHRMIFYMQFYADPPENVGHRFQAFLTSSRETSTKIQHLAYVIHGIAHGCLTGASSDFQRRYKDALRAYNDGVPHLKALGPLLRHTRQFGSAKETKRGKQQQERSRGDRSGGGKPQQLSCKPRGGGIATCSGSRGQKDELPSLDASAYTAAMVEHLQKVQSLNRDCNGMLSSCIGENALKCVMNAVRTVSSSLGFGGRVANVSIYSMLYPPTMESTPAETDSWGGSAHTDSYGATSTAHTAAAGAAAADAAASVGASEDMCRNCQALRRGDDGR